MAGITVLQLKLFNSLLTRIVRSFMHFDIRYKKLLTYSNRKNIGL